MASTPRLKNTLAFSLDAGEEVVLPHELSDGQKALSPDIIFIPSPDLTATSDDVAVTLTNTGAAPLSGSALVEAWHTIERAFGDTANKDLPVKPVVVVSAESNGEPPTPPYPDPSPVEITVYARSASAVPAGSDVTGKGTLAAPYETFQRAIRDVPHLIPPGYRYIVDITGIGVESLPPNYAFPSIVAPLKTQYPEAFGGLTPWPFFGQLGFCVRAFPQPASVDFYGAPIPLADTHVAVADLAGPVTYDPITGLAIIEITIPRASWANDALKGTLLVEEDNFEGSCAIHSSDSTHLYVCNAQTFGPPFIGETLHIVECSATLEGTLNSLTDGGAIEIHNCPQISFHGIKMTALDPDGLFGPYGNALVLNMSTQPRLELCDVQGFVTQMVKPNFRTLACVLRDRIIAVDGSDWTTQKTLLLDVPVIFHVASNGSVAAASVFDGCPALEGAGGYSVNDAYPSLTWTITNVLFRNGTDPRGAVYALAGGYYPMNEVEVNNPAGPGLVFEGGAVYASLNNVGGSSLGLGIRVNDGAQVRVCDDATVITGAAGDMEVGTLGVRTWADFRTALPGPAASGKGIKNEYDLRTFNAGGYPVGDEVTGVDTGGVSGSRLFQRPL